MATVAIPLLLLGVILLWQTVTHGLAAFLATTNPAAALVLLPHQPDALVSLAEEALVDKARDEAAAARAVRADASKASKGNDAEAVSSWSEMALKGLGNAWQGEKKAAASDLAGLGQARRNAHLALRADPLNSRALRILGQLKALDGDEASATRFMQAAASHSLGEIVAVFWMLQDRYKAKDYQTALVFADALMRKRPNMVEHLGPMFAAMAESPVAAEQQALQEALLRNAPWRTAALAALARGARDLRTPLDLLLQLKATEAPPTARELLDFVTLLVQRKQYELAYYTWLQVLPGEQLAALGHLENGSFEKQPSGMPFDWMLPRGGSGVTVDLAARGDVRGQHALFLEFGPGRADFQGISQLILLPPGSYRLEGKMKGELSGPRGLDWRIDCADGQQLAVSPMFIGTAPDWTDIVLDFEVPASDCRAQYLRLELAARSASERLVTGSVLYDDLAIRRVAAQPVAPEEAGPAPSPDALP